MATRVDIIGAGLAGSEAALQLAARGVDVRLIEMRPVQQTAVHKSGLCAELVCSNSLKSMDPNSAAGMLKSELAALGSFLLAAAFDNRVAAGGALAVDREAFAGAVTAMVEADPRIEVARTQAEGLESDADAVVLASGPMTEGRLAAALATATGQEHLAFFDAAAPIVLADSLDLGSMFRQSRYDGSGPGDYLNAPFDKEDYLAFVHALTGAERVVLRSFEGRDLFAACQPIEEIARTGLNAPRFGPLKPVGLRDPRTGRRPWAAVQLRAEDALATSYNLVGFQTNLTFPEQERVFRMIPGLEQARFARFGVMHRNTFIDAPRLLGCDLRLRRQPEAVAPVFVAGQLSGTEGYCEAMMSGLVAALACYALLEGQAFPELPRESAFGALLAHATDPAVADYQPMHVNFGVMVPLAPPVRARRERYAAFARRGQAAMEGYVERLAALGLLPRKGA